MVDTANVWDPDVSDSGPIPRILRANTPELEVVNTVVETTKYSINRK